MPPCPGHWRRRSSAAGGRAGAWGVARTVPAVQTSRGSPAPTPAVLEGHYAGEGARRGHGWEGL